MTLQTSIHLNFRGQARAALDFYQSVFGGSTTITTYHELGMPQDAPGAENVVFGQVIADNGFHVMAYDIPGEQDGKIAGGGSTRRENGITLTDQACFVSVAGETIEELGRYWNALAADAVIVEPLAASAWSAGFGMLTDRFGVTWSLTVVTG